MITDWQSLANLQQRQYERFIQGNKTKEFRYWLRYLIDLPYKWGEENLFGTDCSGTACFALLRMGYNIRTTADGLFRKVFTTSVHEDAVYEDVYAVFYMASSGEVKHVTPVMGRHVVLDATPDGIRLYTAIHTRIAFEQRGMSAIWRKINWNHAEDVSAGGKESWGVDPMLSEIAGK